MILKNSPELEEKQKRELELIRSLAGEVLTPIHKGKIVPCPIDYIILGFPGINIQEKFTKCDNRLFWIGPKVTAVDEYTIARFRCSNGYYRGCCEIDNAYVEKGLELVKNYEKKSSDPINWEVYIRELPIDGFIKAFGREKRFGLSRDYAPKN